MKVIMHTILQVTETNQRTHAKRGRKLQMFRCASFSRHLYSCAGEQLHVHQAPIYDTSVLSLILGERRRHLSRTGHWQPVQLEAVWPVAVGRLRLEVLGQVDNGDCRKRALLTPNRGRARKRTKTKRQSERVDDDDHMGVGGGGWGGANSISYHAWPQ